MERVALDTTFLIDLQNERRSRGQARGAHNFLRRNSGTELWLPAVALGEYLEGFEDPYGDQAQALVGELRVLEITREVAKAYANAARHLRVSGRLIGANDLWIGCTAQVAKLPVVTRNVEHFRRIPHLKVIDYGASRC